MTEPLNNDLPAATTIKNRISPVWFVPLIALIIAIVLGVQAWQKKGEEIEIIFESAGGIQVGKTEIRLKDVPVGKVTKLNLSEDLKRVHATVTLDRTMSRHLSEKTRFWLVTPRISSSGISNLGTLVSGVYIVMDPGKKVGYKDSFVGLSEPPAVQSDEKGTQFILRAENLGSLDVGSPVYYRQLRVGEVVNYQLSKDGSHVDARIFVFAPYDALVSSRSHFWNVSGFDVSVGIEGVKAEMASISSLLLGGVAFESPVISESNSLAKANFTFALYDNKQAASEGRYKLGYSYLLKFSYSVKGLVVGAPVEFRGIKVGQVEEVRLADMGKAKQSLEVYIRLEPQRFDDNLVPSREELDDMLSKLVSEGLRAEIKTGNLLLGSKNIELYFKDDATPDSLVMSGAIAQIPTIDEPFDQVDRFTRALSQLPTESIGKSVDETFKSLNSILKVFKDKKTAEALHGTLANAEKATEHLDVAIDDARVTLNQLTQALKSVDHTIATDSQLHAEFLQTLKSVGEASESFDRFVEELYRYPNSLVFGLGKDE